ncbi:MAG: lipopolysaccharide assembly protein LapA domain-containing protein [Azospirillaceae bacterium]|nr:lipopolysaccharide assembly protein LapA domain-containing protein [Azospirillaceae bacterium]
MRYLSWIITLPIAVIAVSFALSNRAAVTLTLWPIPFTVETPLYLVALVTLFVGFVGGGIVAHISGAPRRRTGRFDRRRADRLEREVVDWKARAEAAERRIAGQNAARTLTEDRTAA